MSATATNSIDFVNLVSEKGKECLETLALIMQTAIEQKRSSVRDAFLREHSEKKAQSLLERNKLLEQEREPELAKVLGLANDVG